MASSVELVSQQLFCSPYTHVLCTRFNFKLIINHYDCFPTNSNNNHLYTCTYGICKPSLGGIYSHKNENMNTSRWYIWHIHVHQIAMVYIL